MIFVPLIQSFSAARITSQAERAPARAFTLIELLAVIAIIAVLAALILPAIGRMKISAMRAQSVANLRTLHTACMAYANDHNGDLPNAWTQPGGDFSREWGQWADQLSFGGYLGEPDGIIPAEPWQSSPMMPQNFKVLGSPVQWHYARHLTLGHDPKRHKTYSMNGEISSFFNTASSPPNRKIAHFLYPSRTMLIAEGTVYPGTSDFGPIYWPRDFPSHTGDKVAMVFLDGHTEVMKLEDFPGGEPLPGYTVPADEAERERWWFWVGRESR